MADTTARNNDGTSPEQARVAGQLKARLEGRGVMVSATDSVDNLGSLLEAVEAFESAVEANGGDLMVDEAPSGKTTQPDNANFVLPARTSNELAAHYIARITSAMSNMRR